MAKLTNKQRLFVEFYLSNGLNATDAARRAGYKGNYQTLRAIASQNLTKTTIRTLIDKRLEEAAMNANEVLYRLTEQAKAPDMTQFLEMKDTYIQHPILDGEVMFNGVTLTVDLNKIQELGLGHLIKSIGQTSGGIKIEWYNAKEALELLGRHHGLFKDQIEHSGSIAQTSVKIFMPDNSRGDRNG